MRIFLFILFFCTSAIAHQDRIIKVDGNKLIGLPKQFQPATFDFSKKTLNIAQLQVTFPSCLPDNFIFNSEMSVYSSWYHSYEYTGLPPYIGFRFDGSEFGLIINLETLEPIPIEWGYGKNESEIECIAKFEVKKKT